MMSPSLKSLGQKCVIDLLNSLDKSHVVVLSSYFGSEVTIDKIDYKIVKNVICDLDTAELELSEIQGFQNLAFSRDKDHLYVCFWR